MKKLLKLFGVGILTGAGTRAGIMLMEAMFPGGFSSLFTKFKLGNVEQPKQEDATSLIRRI